MLLDVCKLIQLCHLLILKQDHLVGGDTVGYTASRSVEIIKFTRTRETKYDNLHLITVKSKVFVQIRLSLASSNLLTDPDQGHERYPGHEIDCRERTPRHAKTMIRAKRKGIKSYGEGVNKSK